MLIRVEVKEDLKKGIVEEKKGKFWGKGASVVVFC